MRLTALLSPAALEGPVSCVPFCVSMMSPTQATSQVLQGHSPDGGAGQVSGDQPASWGTCRTEFLPAVPKAGSPGDGTDWPHLTLYRPHSPVTRVPSDPSVCRSVRTQGCVHAWGACARGVRARVGVHVRMGCVYIEVRACVGVRVRMGCVRVGVRVRTQGCVWACVRGGCGLSNPGMAFRELCHFFSN